MIHLLRGFWFSFIFLVFILGCKSIQQTPLLNQKRYEDELIATFHKIEQGRRINDKTIVNLIPKNEKQYLVFYSMTYPDREDEIRNSFYKLDSIIIDRANHNYEILDVYILLSQFVDGEYAEGYFDNLEYLIGHNRQEFCSLFSREAEKLSRINNYYNENCKDQ
jgi:hypothetical protein